MSTDNKINEKQQPKKWMKKAFGKNKGGLHRALKVPADKKIPEEKLEKASHSKDAHVRHMAQAAKNANEADMGQFNFRNLLDAVKEGCGCCEKDPEDTHDGEESMWAEGDNRISPDVVEDDDVIGESAEDVIEAPGTDVDPIDDATKKSAARNAQVVQNEKDVQKEVGQNCQQQYANDRQPKTTALGQLSEEPKEELIVEEPKDDISVVVAEKAYSLKDAGKEEMAKEKSRAKGKTNLKAISYPTAIHPTKASESKLREGMQALAALKVGDPVTLHYGDDEVEMVKVSGKTEKGITLKYKGKTLIIPAKNLQDQGNYIIATSAVQEKKINEMAGEADHYRFPGKRNDTKSGTEVTWKFVGESKEATEHFPTLGHFLLKKTNEGKQLEWYQVKGGDRVQMVEMSVATSDASSGFRSIYEGARGLMGKFGLNEEQSMGPGGGSGTVAMDAGSIPPTPTDGQDKAQNPESFDRAEKQPEGDEHGEKEYFGKQGDDNYYYILATEDDSDANMGGIPSEEKPDVTPDVVPADMAPVGEEEVAHESRIRESASVSDDTIVSWYKEEKARESAMNTQLLSVLVREIKTRGIETKVKESASTMGGHEYPEDRSFGELFRAEYLKKAKEMKSKPKDKTEGDLAARKEIEDLEKSWKADNSMVPNESISKLVESFQDMADAHLIAWYKEEMSKKTVNERLLNILKVELEGRGIPVPVKEKVIREGYSSLQIIDASGKVVADAEGQNLDPNDIKGFLLQSMDDLELTEIAPDIVKKYLLVAEDEPGEDEMTNTPEPEEQPENPDDLHKNNEEDKQRGATVAQESKDKTMINALMEKYQLVSNSIASLLEKYGLREIRTINSGSEGFKDFLGDLELENEDGDPLKHVIPNTQEDHMKAATHAQKDTALESKLLEKFQLNEAEPVKLKPRPEGADAPVAAAPAGDDKRDQDLTGQPVTPEPDAGTEPAPATVEPVTGEAGTGMGPAPAAGPAEPIGDVQAQDMSSPESAKAYIQSEYPEEPYTSTALAFADSMIADPAVYGQVRDMQWKGIWTDADTLEKQAKIVGEYGNFSPNTVKAITDKWGNSAKYKLARNVRPVIYLTVRDVGEGVEPTSLSELKGISGAREVVATENPGECKIVY